MVFIVSERLRVAQVSVSLNEKLAWDLGKKKKKGQILSSTQGVMCVFGKKREGLYPPPPTCKVHSEACKLHTIKPVCCLDMLS